MERGIKILAVVAVCTTLAQPNLTTAQAPIPATITTPNTVESRIGPLDFKDGVPSNATAAKVYDQVDFTHAYNAFMNTMS